jgi:hypothetical protein
MSPRHLVVVVAWSGGVGLTGGAAASASGMSVWLTVRVSEVSVSATHLVACCPVYVEPKLSASG